MYGRSRRACTGSILAEEIADVLISVNAMVGSYDLDSYVKEWLERKYERNKDTYR